MEKIKDNIVKSGYANCKTKQDNKLDKKKKQIILSELFVMIIIIGMLFLVFYLIIY